MPDQGLILPLHQPATGTIMWKTDLLGLIGNFYHHDYDLSAINKANIVMIPKSDAVVLPTDYRPISIINNLT
jgi:hypothetical protein